MRSIIIATLAGAALCLSACTRLENDLDRGTAYGTNQNRLTRKVDEPRDANGKRSRVNAYLWQAAMDTVGAVPLLSGDSRTGLILTDWYSAPSTANERTQMKIEVLDGDLRKDTIRVSIARQVSRNGDWIDAPSAAGSAETLEELILTKARDNRR